MPPKIIRMEIKMKIKKNLKKKRWMMEAPGCNLLLKVEKNKMVPKARMDSETSEIPLKRVGSRMSFLKMKDLDSLIKQS